MAQGTYTVTRVEQGRTYSDDYGGKQVYMVGLKDARADSPSGLFELHRKPTSKAPAVGDGLEVDRFITGTYEGQPFTKIKLVWTERPGGTGGGGGGGGNPRRDQGPGLRWHNAPYNSSASHPRDEVRMIRTSALSSAPAFIEQMLTLSLAELNQPKNAKEYWALVDYAVERIEARYAKALGAYDQRVSPQQQLPEAEVPADTDGLSEEQRAHDASLPF